jgi:hypothetical protein
MAETTPQKTANGAVSQNSTANVFTVLSPTQVEVDVDLGEPESLDGSKLPSTALAAPQE